MSEPVAEHLTHRTPSDASTSALEPPWALIVGGLAGAAGFLLFAFLFGARWAIAVAALAAILALVKQVRFAAIAFVVAGALSAVALAPSTIAIFSASLAFGVGLAIAARAYAHRHASDTAG